MYKKKNFKFFLICTFSILAAFIIFSCKTAPETTVSYTEELYKLLVENKFDEAITYYESMPESLRNEYEMQKLKVSIYISAGRLDEAFNLCTELLEENSKDPDLLYIEANIYNARGDEETYITKLQNIIKLHPKHEEALGDLGEVYLGKKNYKQAEIYFTKALSINSRNANALTGLGRVKYKSSNFEEALKLLDSALAIDETQYIAWADRGKVNYEMGRYKDAIEDVKKSLSYYPDDYFNWFDLATYYLKLNKKDEALSALDKAIEINPDYYLPYIYRAGLNDQSGNYEVAKADYNKIIELFPDYYYANECLGILQWHEGLWSEAYKNFYAAYQHNPNQPSYAFMCAACMYKAGTSSARIKKFLDPVFKNIERDSLNYYIGRLLYDMTGESDVIFRIQKENGKSQKSRALFYLGLYYELKDRKDLALKYYQEAKDVVIVPSYFEYRFVDWALKEAVN